MQPFTVLDLRRDLGREPGVELRLELRLVLDRSPSLP
jgi:hypothetical protein